MSKRVAIGAALALIFVGCGVIWVKYNWFLSHNTVSVQADGSISGHPGVRTRTILVYGNPRSTTGEVTLAAGKAVNLIVRNAPEVKGWDVSATPRLRSLHLEDVGRVDKSAAETICGPASPIRRLYLTYVSEYPELIAEMDKSGVAFEYILVIGGMTLSPAQRAVLERSAASVDVVTTE